MNPLTPKQWKEVKDEVTAHAKAEMSLRIADTPLDEVILFTKAELCGRFNVLPKAIDAMDIPRIDLTGNGSAIRYSLASVKAYLAAKEVKP
jgi:hypothetical protein